MLDPYITPCCDQKLLRFFFERVDNTGHSSFFCKEDYRLPQFLAWVIDHNPMSEMTLAIPAVDDNTFALLRLVLNKKYYCFSDKKNVPLIHHLNLITGKDVTIPEDILNHPLVTVAQDTFTYNYLLIHKLWTDDASNTNLEADTAAQRANLDALIEKAGVLSAMLDTKPTRLAYEQLEGAWIDFMLSSELATSTKGTYYTLHGVVPQNRDITNCTSSVTCIKGKYAYDEVMKVLSSVLRTRKVKAPNP